MGKEKLLPVAPILKCSGTFRRKRFKTDINSLSKSIKFFVAEKSEDKTQI